MNCFEYIYPLTTEKFVPSIYFFDPIKAEFSDIVAASTGDESYAGQVSKITSFTTSYEDGATESDEVNVYVVFENKKSDSELATLKTIVDTARSSFDKSDPKHNGRWDSL
tara:strand:- start:53 stop:382 length:330 start_codon:yes stop_codon:yes gene_type:complete